MESNCQGNMTTTVLVRAHSPLLSITTANYLSKEQYKVENNPKLFIISKSPEH